MYVSMYGNDRKDAFLRVCMDGPTLAMYASVCIYIGAVTASFNIYMYMHVCMFAHTYVFVFACTYVFVISQWLYCLDNLLQISNLSICMYLPMYVRAHVYV